MPLFSSFIILIPVTSKPFLVVLFIHYRPRPQVIESNTNTLSCPDKRVSFKIKPSESSAFCSLLPDYPPGVLVREVAGMQIKETSCAE